MILTPWESETRLVAMILATGLVKEGRAESVLLVGPPEQGKTTMLQRFDQLPTTRLITDTTSFGLRRLISADTGKQMRHLLMPELERLFTRDQRVASQSANLLSNLMTGDAGEEMIGRDKYDFTGRQIGILGAMTSATFEKREQELEDFGMRSRFHVIRVDRDKQEQERVVWAMLNGDGDDKSKVKWPTLMQPPLPVRFNPREYAAALKDWRDTTIGINKGERFVERCMSYLRAIALLGGRDFVTHADVVTLQAFTPFFVGKKHVRLDWPPEGGRYVDSAE